MAKFLPIIIGLLVIGLFVISLVTFGIKLAILNDANQSIGDDPALQEYAATVNQSLNDYLDTANSADESLAESPLTSTSTGLTPDAVGGVWKSIKSSPTLVYSATLGLLKQKIFGDSSYAIILDILAAILILIIIFAVIYLLYTGAGF